MQKVRALGCQCRDMKENGRAGAACGSESILLAREERSVLKTENPQWNRKERLFTPVDSTQSNTPFQSHTSL